MSALEISFLGSPEIRLNGRGVNLPTRKALALLAYLACEPGSHPREKLAALLWPEHDETAGRTALRKALGFLNEGLSADGSNPFFKVSRDAIGFNHDPDVARGCTRVPGQSPAPRENQVQAASSRAGSRQSPRRVPGWFFTGRCPEIRGLVHVRREACAATWIPCCNKLLEPAGERDHIEVALATARKRLQLDPMNEVAHRALIELHLETGDRAGALEAFKVCQTVLERELGIPPAPETLALVERARHAPTSSRPEAEAGVSLSLAAVTVQPRSLVPVAPAGAFVGREREWAMLEDAWQDNLIAYVSGEPGSGKSRLMLEFLQRTRGFRAARESPWRFGRALCQPGSPPPCPLENPAHVSGNLG